MSKKAVRPRKRAKAPEAEEHINHERWLITYGDMLTLLMVLFIVLFAMSQIDQNKFAELKQGLAIGFGSQAVTFAEQNGPLDVGGAANSQVNTLNPGVTPNLNPNSSGDQNSVAKAVQQAVDAAQRAQASQQASDVQKEIDNFKQIERMINNALKQQGINDPVQYSIDQRGLVVTVVTSSVIFAGDRADLLPEGQRLVGALAPIVTALPNDIEVDGHTNQLPVPTINYPTAWELSTARASTVVRYLADHGVAPSRMMAAGFAGYRPLYAPSDPRAPTLNRRVDIVVLSTLPAAERGLLPSAAN